MGRFRRGVLIGFAAGYVLGARAGRERYEAIMRGWSRIQSSQPYRQTSSKVGAALGLGVERGRAAAAGRLRKVNNLRNY